MVLTAEVIDFVTDSRGGRLVRFEPAGCNAAGDPRTLDEAIHAAGHVPLPPYITDYEGDPEKYQTVYAKELGSAAAPTAGLHFTPQLMDTIRSRGVNIAEVTLHVGLGIMRERAERIGARISLDTQAGQGTCVTLELPPAGREAPGAAATMAAV